MKRNSNRKLSLSRQTLQQLTGAQLGDVAGGGTKHCVTKNFPGCLPKTEITCVSCNGDCPTIP